MNHTCRRKKTWKCPFLWEVFWNYGKQWFRNVFEEELPPPFQCLSVSRCVDLQLYQVLRRMERMVADRDKWLNTYGALCFWSPPYPTKWVTREVYYETLPGCSGLVQKVVLLLPFVIECCGQFHSDGWHDSQRPPDPRGIAATYFDVFHLLTCARLSPFHDNPSPRHAFPSQTPLPTCLWPSYALKAQGRVCSPWPSAAIALSLSPKAWMKCL